MSLNDKYIYIYILTPLLFVFGKNKGQEAIVMKCEFEGSTAQLDAAKGSYFEIPTYFWLLSVEVAFLYSLYPCVPSPRIGKTTQACSETETGLPPSLGLPSPNPVTPCLSEQFYWCFWNNLCVPFFFFYLLPCFSLEEPKLGSLRLTSALK